MLSHKKSQALRSVNYLSSSKVILVFHSAWWKENGTQMGGIITGREIKKSKYKNERFSERNFIF